MIVLFRLYSDNSFFELKFIDFEFTTPHNKYDKEWINVEVTCYDEYYSWTKSGPYLMKSEIPIIRSWLLDISNHCVKFGDTLTFIENELSFRFNENTFQVLLDFNFHPKGEEYQYGRDTEYSLDFILNSKELYQVIGDLSKGINLIEESQNLNNQ